MPPGCWGGSRLPIENIRHDYFNVVAQRWAVDGGVARSIMIRICPPVAGEVASPRTIAIGDIHGCDQALLELIARVRPSGEDTVVTLGDYVDRGPDSRGVLTVIPTIPCAST